MFIVRDTFRCKPGHAKDLVAKFKAAAPHLQGISTSEVRIMTDRVTDFWTVALEIEVESLDEYWKAVESRGNIPAVREAMAGYMDLVLEGKREIFHLE